MMSKIDELEKEKLVLKQEMTVLIDSYHELWELAIEFWRKEANMATKITGFTIWHDMNLLIKDKEYRVVNVYKNLDKNIWMGEVDFTYKDKLDNLYQELLEYKQNSLENEVEELKRKLGKE